MPPSTAAYLRAFEQIRDVLAPQLTRAALHCEVSYRLNSASLTISKPTWNSGTASPRDARIFFCIWIPDKPKVQNRLTYSIHALRTWRLKTKSHTFATVLRQELSANLKPWPNVSLDHGPANVMEGWIDVGGPDSGNMSQVARLVQSFIPVAPTIDRLLTPKL